jgi:hypothetical protein
MEAVKVRVINELNDLTLRIEKLESFIKSNLDYQKLSIMQQQLLQAQLSLMKSYAVILTVRISFM